MAKRIIRTGTTADPTGDSLKNAFTKVNDNFTELYNALGLDADGLNLGAFEFTGSVMTTTDSSAIIIDQAVTVTSDLTVGGDILPSTANGGDLGSLLKPFRSLYVSTGTVYMGGVPLRIGPNNTLTVNGAQVGSGDTDRLTNNGQELVLDANGQLTFPGGPTFGDNILTGSAGSDLAIETEDGGSSKLWTFGVTGATTFPNNTILSEEGNDISIASSSNDGGTGATITLHRAGGEGGSENTNPNSGDIDIFAGVDGGAWNDNTNGGDTGNIRLRTSQYTGSVVNEWKFDNNGWLHIPDNRGLLGAIDEDIKVRARDHDDDGFAVQQEVVDSGDIVRGRTQLERDSFKIEFYDNSGDPISYNRFRPTYLEIEGDIHSKYGGSTSLLVNGADNNSTVALKVIDNTDTIQSYLSVKNNSIKLSTAAGAEEWVFSSDGSLTFPDTTQQTTAYTGTADIARNIESEGDVSIKVNLTDSTQRVWRFGEDGDLVFPDSTVQSTAFTGNATALVNGSYSISAEYNGIDIKAPLTWKENNTDRVTLNYSTLDDRFVIGTNVAGVTKAFYFGDNGNFTIPGNITFPDASVQTTAWTGTLTVNDSGLTINGGTGTIYQGPTGALQAGDKKGGVYHATSTSSNGLFTFGINGGGIMSAAVEGSLFVGTSMPSNNGGVTTAYGGWLVVENGGKFGTDVDTLGNVILGKGVFEKFQTKQDATGTVEHDCLNGHIFYHTSPDANWTANFTNLNIATSYATSVTIVITQGGTGYYPNAVQIGGVGQTINWQGNATPTPSTNRTDVVTFSIINNAGTYTVLGQLTGF